MIYNKNWFGAILHKVGVGHYDALGNNTSTGAGVTEHTNREGGTVYRCQYGTQVIQENFPATPKPSYNVKDHNPQ